MAAKAATAAADVADSARRIAWRTRRIAYAILAQAPGQPERGEPTGRAACRRRAPADAVATPTVDVTLLDAETLRVAVRPASALRRLQDALQRLVDEKRGAELRDRHGDGPKVERVTGAKQTPQTPALLCLPRGVAHVPVRDYPYLRSALQAMGARGIWPSPAVEYHLLGFDPCSNAPHTAGAALRTRRVDGFVLVPIATADRRSHDRVLRAASKLGATEAATFRAAFARLFGFQRDGVAAAVARGGRLLLADDMGLGKTPQALCIAQYCRRDWPLLIVCPSGVRAMWVHELQAWLGLPADVINNVRSGRDVPHEQRLVTVVSYDLLQRHAALFHRAQYGMVILDESHYVKNAQALRTTAALPLVQRARRALLLSGTPALSRPAELYTQVNALRPGLLGDFHQYGVRYCNGRPTPFGWDYSGHSRLAELHALLNATVLLRRMKDDVLHELPQKRHTTVRVPISRRILRELDRLHGEWQQLETWIRAKTLDATQRTRLERQRMALSTHLYRLTGLAKVAGAGKVVLQGVRTGHKQLVFAHHLAVLDGIAQCLTQHAVPFIRIDGAVPATQRAALCEHFQRTPSVVPVALLGLTAAGVGLTLTAADRVVMAELYWNPGQLTQAEDRAHRIGQMADAVDVVYVIGDGNPFDEAVLRLLQRKQQVLGGAGIRAAHSSWLRDAAALGCTADDREGTQPGGDSGTTTDAAADCLTAEEVDRLMSDALAAHERRRDADTVASG